MVRGKTQLRRIENATSRQVTFSKRRNGLLKKAFELSVLCDAEIALIIFSARGKLYEFATSSYEAANVVKKMEHLESSIWKILGEKLESCSLEELHELEGKLEKGLCNMRRKKASHLPINRRAASTASREGRRSLQTLPNNIFLQYKRPFAATKEVDIPGQHTDVETELCIGCPGRGRRNSMIPI
ncbi:hypothetical protein MUK42_27719 [Musa troglodytarum]|uniref:MADS-box domain-containing protein n=1 Tax=Musa troglodytarum TaxID=320322 RepID=A0A9E7F8F1_9LILI|nr:hypothetical protein MUK42_27719 [Musa troglodytarum]